MPDLTLAFSRDAITRVLVALTDLAAGTVTTTFKLNEDVAVDINANWRIPADYQITFDDNPDAIRLNELDLIFDVLNLSFRINIPTVTIGGNCVARDPRGVCVTRLPVTTLFAATDDLTIPVVLNGFRSEFSGEMALNLVHFKTEDADLLNAIARGYRDGLLANLDQLAPDAPPELLDFFRMAYADGWELRVEPHWIDIDPIDVPDQAADSLNTQLDNAINAFGAGLPESVRKALHQISGGFSNLIRDLLDLPDDLQEFLLNLLTSASIVDQILEELSNELGFLYLIKIPDQPKFEISREIPPVSIKITDADLEIEPEELTIEVDIAVADL